MSLVATAALMILDTADMTAQTIPLSHDAEEEGEGEKGENQSVAQRAH